MGLWSRLFSNGLTPTEDVAAVRIQEGVPPGPPRYPFESTMDRHAGYYIWSTVAYQTPPLVEQLKQIPNAGPQEIMDVLQSASSLCELARRLQEVDAELIRASRNELKWTFDEFGAWEERANRLGMMIRGPYHPRHVFHYLPEDDGGKNHYKQDEREARDWAQKSLSEPELGSFLALLERRAEMREAAQQAYDGFQTVKAGIEEASRRAQLVKSAGAIDPVKAVDSAPEVALESVKDAQEAVAAINAGLDAAYPLALPAPAPGKRRLRGVAEALGDKRSARPR